MNSEEIENTLFSRPEVRDAMIAMVNAIDPEADEDMRLHGLMTLAEMFNGNAQASAVGGALVSLAMGYVEETEAGGRLIARVRQTVAEHAMKDGRA